MSSPREALPPAPLPALASSAPTHYGQNARSWVYALGGTVRVARVPAVETQRARIRRLQPLWNDSLWPLALIMALNCSKGNALSAGDVPVVFQLMNRSKDG